ncbi:MAG: hypothetical protein AB1349_00570 [Elusimicrobiota bacterium]
MHTYITTRWKDGKMERWLGNRFSFLSFYFSIFLSLYLSTCLYATASAPKVVEDGVLFTFDAKNAHKVYLAGSFKKDNDGNSVVNFSELVTVTKKRLLVEGRILKPLIVEKIKKNLDSIYIKKIVLHKIWIKPNEETKVTVDIENIESKKKDTTLVFYVKKFDNQVLAQKETKKIEKSITFEIQTKSYSEDGYIFEFELKEKEKVIDREYEVISIVKNISDDLRYGFYANWDKIGADYKKKTDYFAQLHINAIEYYDYFPAHGYYAPKEKMYKSEPFGITILADDIQQKIDSARDRNILSVAYVAAYSASKSIYEKYPYPMTDEKGNPKVFNGSITTELDAKNQNKDIWFYLMAIAQDTKWYSYIMEQFRKTMDNSADDLVSFDGFEIDSYGHSKNERYYSASSKYNGELLSTIIMTFVNAVRKIAHKIKPDSVVSFNCVNEYGIEQMCNIVDFLFIENWAGYKSGLEDLVDICYKNRVAKNQRVVIKLYPADTVGSPKIFSKECLKYLLGAAMTGGGSVMVAGEPDEQNNRMHALNTLYYPDNVAMPDDNFGILKNYYTFDTLLYRITHGKNVNNLKSDFELPDCITREFLSNRYIVVSILHNGNNSEWNQKVATPNTLENYEIAYTLPKNKKPVAVYYGTPDYEELLIPKSLDWELKDGYIRTLLPKLETYGVLIIETIQ